MVLKRSSWVTVLVLGLAAQGGSKPAAELVHDFLGRPFSFDALAAWLNTGTPAPSSP